MSNFFPKGKNKTHSKLREIKPISTKMDVKNITLPFKPSLTNIRPTKTFVASKNKLIKNIKINSSVFLKEEIKKKISPINRNNKAKKILKKSSTNYNKKISSNILFSARDKNKEKNQKNNFKKNFTNSKINLFQLDNELMNFNLKQTIIIDNEGNNNLHLCLNSKYNKFNKNKFNEKNEISINSFNNETNSLFEKSTNYNNNNILNILTKDNIIENETQNTEEVKRLKEYNKIINLLNTNIEQFKKMFNKKISNNNPNKNKNKKILIKNKNNIKIPTIPLLNINNRNKKNIAHEDKYSNLKKNLSEDNIKQNKKKPDYIFFDINNDEFSKNNFNDQINNKNIYNELQNSYYSFLESSINNEFYQSLINNSLLRNISHTSLDMNIDKISNKENIEINMNKINNINDNGNKIINSTKISPKNSINKWFNNNFLLKNNNTLNANKNQIGNDNHNNYQSYINVLDGKNCIIF